MTGGKDAQDKQDNKELFPEPVQPIEQKGSGKDIANKNIKAALNAILESEKETLQIMEKMSFLYPESREIKENLEKIEAALNEDDFPAFPTVGGATPIGKQTFLNIVNRFFEWYQSKVQEFIQSSGWKQLKENFPDITEDTGADLYFCALAIPIVENMQGFKEKIAEYEKTHNCKLSFADLINTEGATFQNGLTLAEQFLNELGALDTGSGEPGAANQEQEQEEPQRAIIKRAANIDYPVDKINSIVWGLMEQDTKGQISFNLAKRGSEKKILAYYAINFDDLGENLTITKRLLPFDKRVYIAISALFNAGNDAITLSQIYYAMGYTGRPGTKDLTKIDDSITKMTGARIFFDNKQEAATYNYVRFKYDGSLLPIERRTVIVNGKLADAAIYVFREPPLMTFARQRKQITSVDIKLLQSPISKTDANLQIEDYLIERISQEKNGKKSNCRILFKTIYSHTGIADKPKTNTERQQKKRAPGKIESYLKHYQKTGFITGYTMEKDGISIFFE